MNAMSATYVGVDVAKDSVAVRSVNAAKIYIATNFLGHGTVNPKANESDD